LSGWEQRVYEVWHVDGIVWTGRKRGTQTIGPTMSTTNPIWYDPGFEAGDYRLLHCADVEHTKKKDRPCTVNITFWRVSMAFVAVKK